MKIASKLWIGIIILIILSPLGIILPQYLESGSAWGEWSVDEVKRVFGYVPRGLEKLSSLWNAPLPDYTFQGWQEKGLIFSSLGYIVSAALGVIITLIIVLFIGRKLTKKGG